MKPVLFVTGNAPPERVGAFAALHEREDVVFALFGGAALHSTAGATEDLPFPAIHPRQYELRDARAFRAVVCGTGGRIAFPAAYAAARRARVPFVLWSSLWAHPRSLAGAAGWPLLRRAYRHADAVVTYGPHVSRYVRRHGARNVHEAPQAVDNAFWGAPTGEPRGDRPLFVGRPERQKGWDTLRAAWPEPITAVGPGMPEGVVDAATLRTFYARAGVLVVPSLPTATVRETWGLVVNEAMNQGTPVIASDAVGAAAGGLVRHERTGLVVPAGDVVALRAAIERALGPEGSRWGEQARRDVAAYTFEAWAGGVSEALRSVDAAR